MRALEEIIADFEKRIAALEGQVQAQHSVEKLAEELEFYTKNNLKGEKTMETTKTAFAELKGMPVEKATSFEPSEIKDIKKNEIPLKVTIVIENMDELRKLLDEFTNQLKVIADLKEKINNFKLKVGTEKITD